MGASGRRLPAFVAALLFFVCRALSAGVYNGIVKCEVDNPPCTSGTLVTLQPPQPGEDPAPFPAQPSGIVHPVGYAGTGGNLEIKLCVASGNDSLLAPTERAIVLWNALSSATGNCDGCVLWEEVPPTTGKYHAESTILHELGHCAMGLGHINLEIDLDNDNFLDFTSFTNSLNASRVGVAPGPDGIRGSLDDTQNAPLGAIPDSVHYYRISDNDPVVIDALVIDKDTYSRSVVNDLPAGHGWTASGNRAVAQALGAPNTQASMYSGIARSQIYSGLTADEINTVKMGMTGLDQIAGTADDYTISLLLLPSCGSGGADIEVKFFSFSSIGLEGIAGCTSQIDFSAPPASLLNRHYSIFRDPIFPMELLLNEDFSWNTGGPDLLLSKTDGEVTVNPGDTIVYTLSVENIGDEDATGVVVSEVVPAGTTFNAASSHASWSCGVTTPGSVCTLSVGAVNKGAAAQAFAFAVTVDNPTSVVEVANTATAADDGASGPDNDPSNNAASDLTPVDVPCGGTVDLLLTIPGVDPVVVHAACNAITAGTTFTILSGRDVTFKARNLIELTDGFGVESGAAFSAELDPLAGQLPPE